MIILRLIQSLIFLDYTFKQRIQNIIENEFPDVTKRIRRLSF